MISSRTPPTSAPTVPKAMPVFHVEPAQPRSSSSVCSGRASVVRSRSPGTRAPPAAAASSASRTDPPTRWTSKPAAVKRSPSSASTGERSTSSRTVSCTAGGTGSAVGRRGGSADTTSQSSAAARATLLAWLGRADAGAPAAGCVGSTRPPPGAWWWPTTACTGPRAALIGRTDRRGRLLWSLPKGHIEEGETPEDTAVREVAEETGIIGEVVAPLGIIDFWFVADGRRVHKTVHHFLLRAVGGALSDADVEVTEVAWVPLDELSGRLAYADERALVERAPALLADTA